MCHEVFPRHIPAAIIESLILQSFSFRWPMLSEKINLLVVAGYSHLQFLRSEGGSIKPLFGEVF
jgi:hypothetical protein